jgi:DNA-binding MarR family transcriptional regulator
MSEQRAAGPRPGSIGSVARNVGVLSQLYQSRMAVLLEPVGLTYNQLALLSHLTAVGEPQPISAIAEAMEINQPGVTKIVKKLTDAGLLATEDSTHDRRVKLVSLTEAGYQQLGQSMQALGSDVAAWFADWSPDDVATLDRLLSELTSFLDRHRLA